jgi:hypothetical protein
VLKVPLELKEHRVPLVQQVYHKEPREVKVLKVLKELKELKVRCKEL